MDNYNVVFEGFNSNFGRECFRIDFENEYKQTQFIITFNQYNPSPNFVRADTNLNIPNSVYVKFAGDLTEQMVETAIYNILNLISN